MPVSSFPTDPIDFKSRHEEALIGIGSEDGPLANGEKLPEPSSTTHDDIVTVIGRAECLPGKGEEFVNRLRKYHVPKFNDPTLLAYAIHEQVDNPDDVWIYEAYKSRHHFQKHLSGHSEEENKSYGELLVNVPPRAPAIDLVMLPAAISKGLHYYEDYKGFEAQTKAKDFLQDDEPDAQVIDTCSLLFGRSISTDIVECTDMVTTISRHICKPDCGKTMVQMLKDHYDEYVKDEDNVLTYAVHQQMDQPDHVWTYATFANGAALLKFFRGFSDCKNKDLKVAMEDILLTTFDHTFSPSRLHNEAIQGVMVKDA